MSKKFIIVFLFICIFSSAGSCAENESKYSTSLSRMEREWLYREYPSENDEDRISRLEEKVFGTVHDIDTKTRYTRLRKAFDAQKNRIKKQKRMFSGIPTSIPINIDGLIEE